MRWIWGAVGFLSLGVGLFALIVPVLPTTPFLILAAACWMRGFPRLERWLVEHRHLGAPIRDWRAGRGVSLRLKWILAVMSALGLGLALWRLPADATALRVAAACGGLLTAWILLSLPSRPKS